MEIALKKFADCYREAYVSLSVDEVNGFFEKELINLQKTVEFPGYRKGKVPFEIIEKNFSEKLGNLVFSAVMAKFYNEISASIKLKSFVDISPVTVLKKGSEFTFFVAFYEKTLIKNEIKPEELVVEYDEHYFDDKIINDILADRLVNYEESTGKLDENDKAILRVTDGDGDGDSDIEVLVDDKSKLIGKKVGDEVTLSIFDLDKFSVSKIGSIKETLDFKIIKVLKPKKLALTDENVASKTPYKTLDEYKENLKNVIPLEVDRKNEANKRKALVSYLLNNIDVELNTDGLNGFLSHKIVTFFNKEISDREESFKDRFFDKKVRENLLSSLDDYYNEYVEQEILFSLADKFDIKPNPMYIEYFLYNRARNEGVTVDEVKKNISEKEMRELEEFAKAQTLIDDWMSKVKFKVKNKIPYSINKN